MSEREKIIALAKECGFGNADVCEGMFYTIFEAFYHAAQREAFEQAAKLVDARYDEYEPWMCGDDVRQLIKE